MSHQSIWRAAVLPALLIASIAWAQESNLRAPWSGQVEVSSQLPDSLLNKLWWDGFGGSLVAGNVVALASYGGSIIAGGTMSFAGGVEVKGIASWDGTSWGRLGDLSFTRAILSMTIYQADLYVGGSFTFAGSTIPSDHIVRWDGVSWNWVGAGTDGDVRKLCVYNDDLIIGGSFWEAGGVPMSNIVKWDGVSWSSLDEGLNGTVYSLVVYDGELIAGGSFKKTGNKHVNGVARWDGKKWRPLGSGVDGTVRELAVYGTDLYAGGSFSEAGGIPVGAIAKWDGSAWSALGAGVQAGEIWTTTVRAMSSFDGSLVVGGNFQMAGGISAHGVAAWDGSAWSSLDFGLNLGGGKEWSIVYSLLPEGSRLLVGGRFLGAGDTEGDNLMSWDGFAWDNEMSNSGLGLSAAAGNMIVLDGSLVVSGSFLFAGGVRVERLGRWDGTSWSPFGIGIEGGLVSMINYNGKLVASIRSQEHKVMRWDEGAWQLMGSILPDAAWELTEYAGGLYALSGNEIIAWDGTNWSAGEVISGDVMTEYDGSLVIGGHTLLYGDGTQYNSIVSWDGASWDDMNGGMKYTLPGNFPGNSWVRSLIVYNGDLIVGGVFNEAGGVPVQNVARWDGTSWSAMGGVTASFREFGVFHGDLFAVASFSGFYFWDGDEWKNMGSIHPANDLQEYQGSLYASGSFQNAGGKPSLNIARWTPNRTGILEPDSRITFSVYPNPLAWSTSILFELEHPGLVHMAVYDVQGRLVSLLEDDFLLAGPHEYQWRGRDALNRRVPAGMYYVRLRSDSETGSEKIVVVD